MRITYLLYLKRLYVSFICKNITSWLVIIRWFIIIDGRSLLFYYGLSCVKNRIVLIWISNNWVIITLKRVIVCRSNVEVIMRGSWINDWRIISILVNWDTRLWICRLFLTIYLIIILMDRLSKLKLKILFNLPKVFHILLLFSIFFPSWISVFAEQLLIVRVLLFIIQIISIFVFINQICFTFIFFDCRLLRSVIKIEFLHV